MLAPFVYMATSAVPGCHVCVYTRWLDYDIEHEALGIKKTSKAQLNVDIVCLTSRKENPKLITAKKTTRLPHLIVIVSKI